MQWSSRQQPIRWCCLAGERACPPEDVGGIYGYAEFLEAIRDPEHPDHDEMLEWVGGAFDPEAYDLARVNRELKRIR
ncbi:MAG: plasmid pRiA4b ORF-3 family protein [Chloroflexi bacterium]|nr:plasmid pRiA4b ORF-3 family protein [Chloroflexota bacterium]